MFSQFWRPLVAKRHQILFVRLGWSLETCYQIWFHCTEALPRYELKRKTAPSPPISIGCYGRTLIFPKTADTIVCARRSEDGLWRFSGKSDKICDP